MIKRIDKDVLTNQIEAVDVWLTGKYSHVFNLVTQRFSYIRQFSPVLVHHMHLIAGGNRNSDLPVAIDLLKKLNQQKKRKLPDDAPLAFIPKKLRPLVKTNGIVDKAGWECALLTAVRDEIKAGNISVKMSKRFGRFDDFFISDSQWAETRERFFKRAGLLYNKSDLSLEEHYTDTHGYTENNFAAFAMLGRRFAPRIRGFINSAYTELTLKRTITP